MKNQLSIRLPQDLRDWLEAHAYLTGRSLNATILAMLSDLHENDPLDSLTIRRLGARFVIRSDYTGQNFGPYGMKETALETARNALEINGFDASNVTDGTDQPNLVRGEMTPEGPRLVIA